MMFAGIVLILLGALIILFGSVLGTVLKTPRGRRLEALLGKVGARVYYLIIGALVIGFGITLL